MQRYSIIIPIHNEKKSIIELLNKLKYYAENNHEVLIIDDGSNDGTTELLQKYNFIKLIICKKNKGKGSAIRLGLLESKYNKIIIFDGDMELYPKDILKLMILNKEKNINCVFGIRKKHLSLRYPFWSLGNYILTVTFNMVNNSNLKDSLCCAKSFYKSDIQINTLMAKKFDIDVNILLFAIWAAKEKNLIISISDFESLHSATIDWQLKIVKKIRSMRMNLKKINNQEFNEIYNELKKLEILTEFIEHEIILSFFFTNGERNKSRKFVKDICVSNLNTYFKFLHIDQFDQNNFLDLIFKKI